MIEIELADGTVLEAPDDADPSAVAKNYLAKTQSQMPSDPTEGNSFLKNAWIGLGGTLPNLALRIKQLAAGAPDADPEAFAGPHKSMPPGPERDAALKRFQQERQAKISSIQSEIDERKRLDAPLMNTGGGVTGRVIGAAGIGTPLLAVPGANTLVGSGMVGGLMGALEPVATGESGTKNTLFGTVGGSAGHSIGKAIGDGVSAAKNKIASLASQKSANAARDATLAAGREAGYIVPPSEANPSWVSNLLERWAGKASVGQAASLKNQQVTNQLVRDSLGLPKDAPITPETLEPVKQAAWSVYDKVKNLGTLTTDKQYNVALGQIAKKHSGSLVKNSGVDDLISSLKQKNITAEDAVNTIKQLRADASAHLNAMNYDPASKALGRAKKEAADVLEDVIERNIAPGSGGPELLKSFRDARVTLAKVNTVEKSLVESTGDVSAKKLSQQLAKGKPLTGELRKAAQFAQAFPRFNQMNVNPVPGGSPLDAVAAIGTSAVTGNPGWMALALGRPAARSAVLSRVFAGSPDYNPGMVTRGAARLGLLEDPDLAQSLGLLGPSIYVGQQ